MTKKLYAVALAMMLAISMTAFAQTGTRSCQKAKSCEITNACCKNPDRCDKANCEKKYDKKSEKKVDKKAA